MLKFVFVKDGVPQYTVSPAHDTMYESGATYGDYVAVACPVDVDEAALLLQHVLVGGEWLDLGAAPSEFHYRDATLATWVPDTTRAVAARKVEVEQERQRRNLAPVLFDGKRLDGDATAQKNLADKLAGVQQRIRLGVGMDPALMVWKDADNLVHVWSDLQAYCDWLAGYVIALEDRGTRLYAATWQHKAALDALTDIDAILAYPVSSGWPE